MKMKLQHTVRVIPMPVAKLCGMVREGEWFMLQTQYVDGGAVFTSDNCGKGYSLDEATTLAQKLRDAFARHR